MLRWLMILTGLLIVAAPVSGQFYLPTSPTPPACNKIGQLYHDTTSGKVGHCTSIGNPGTWEYVMVSGSGPPVDSVFGRTGTVVALPGDYTGAQITEDSTHRFATDTEKTYWNAKQDALGFTAVPTTRTVNGHPLSANVTVTPGDLTLVIGTDVEAYDLDLATIAGISPSNDDLLQRKAGAWTNRTPAQFKTDLVLVKADVGLGSVTNDAQTKAAIVPNTLPSAGQLLIGNAGGTAYAPISASGDVTISSSGVTAIGAGKVTNTMLAGSIAYSKLSLTGAILNADLAGSIAYSKVTLTNSIVNADINSSAAIAYSKLNLTGAILNADLAGSIAYSKLSLTGAILNADLAGSIAYSKLTLTGSIVDADVNASAAIAWTKISKSGSSLADLATRSAGDLSSGSLLAARMPALTGDVTTSAGAIATTLATVNSNVGTFGSATQSVQFTVNGKGLITAAANVTIAPPFSAITGTATAAQGGTGQSTYAKGDILASPGSNTLNKLAVGTDGFVLTADAASTNGVKWAAAAGTGTVTSIATTGPITGGTITTTGTIGCATCEVTGNKDATGGYVGMTLFKINFKSAANTFTSFFTNTNTAARTYTYQDRNGTIADDTDLALKAPLASPALTGTPTTTTAAVDTNTTQIASTAFVVAQASSTNPNMDGTAAPGSSLRYARYDHVHPTDTTRAPLASPTFTGSPAAPTPTAGNSSTLLATTAFVSLAITNASARVEWKASRDFSVTQGYNQWNYLDSSGASLTASPDGQAWSGTSPIVINATDMYPGASLGAMRQWTAPRAGTILISSVAIQLGEGYAGTVNAQTGTTYTVVVGDNGKIITHTNASATAQTLPSAATLGADFNYYDVINLGAGTVTITPTTSTINGTTTLVLTTNQSARIASDGTNYTSGSPIVGDATVTIKNGSTTIYGPTNLYSGKGVAISFTTTVAANDLIKFIVTKLSSTNDGAVRFDPLVAYQ